jgi:membrane-anchored mycosin MYCP
MRSRRAPRLAALFAAGLVASLLSVATPVRADTAEQPACGADVVPTSERLAPARTDDNPPHDRMGIDQAHALATGRGIKVAVIDSGVRPVQGLETVPLFVAPGLKKPLLSGHGTIVASLIAGEHGIAPDATVHDVRVYDLTDADATQGQKPVTSAGIIHGINAVIAAQPSQQFDVVNISLAVRSQDPALKKAIARLAALDVVIVASAGNRTVGSAAPESGTPNSDASVFPADYDHPNLVAVSDAVPAGWNPSEVVVPNRDTDVAAPTVGGVASNATDSFCIISAPATSWAAAQVSGVVALLREAYPRDNASQIVARLLATTEGGGPAPDKQSVESPWTGGGVVQAHDALTRELDIARDGTVRSAVAAASTDAQAPLPPRRTDPFRSARAMLLWFGLLAGALLALAFMVRPLLRRRD